MTPLWWALVVVGGYLTGFAGLFTIICLFDPSTEPADVGLVVGTSAAWPAFLVAAPFIGLVIGSEFVLTKAYRRLNAIGTLRKQAKTLARARVVRQDVE